MHEVMTVIQEAVLGLAGSPWILLAVAVLATIDGFFPPVPSESVIIAVAVLAVAGDGPSLWLLILAGAVGAFCGDLIAYTIGTKLPIERFRLFCSPRGQRDPAVGQARARAARHRVHPLGPVRAHRAGRREHDRGGGRVPAAPVRASSSPSRG